MKAMKWVPAVRRIVIAWAQTNMSFHLQPFRLGAIATGVALMFFANTTEGNFTMLGTLLDKLGTLLPKNFIIANFFPVLLFASSHAVVLWLISGPFREWCQRFYLLDAGKQTLFGLPLLLSVALTAYI